MDTAAAVAFTTPLKILLTTPLRTGLAKIMGKSTSPALALPISHAGSESEQFLSTLYGATTLTRRVIVSLSRERERRERIVCVRVREHVRDVRDRVV